MAQHGGEHNRELLPLRDSVLCSTSLPQDVRVKLAEVADTMGAAHKLDLTGEVTHLIVGNIDTPKYRYVAKERPDIVVLAPSWIEAVQEAWRAGGDIDVEALEKTHRCRTFADLRICITGFPEMAERTRISSIIEHEGGEYHGDLTKQVSHLLVAKPEGAKYKAAKDWGVHAVSLKWLEDSVQRGMALEHKYYDPTMSVQEQGQGAYRKETDPRTSLGKRPREHEAQGSGVKDNSKRKLRRHASRRLEDHSQDMWQDISAADITTVAPPETDQWTAGDEDSQLTLGRPDLQAQSKKPVDLEQNSAAAAASKPEGLFSGWRIAIQGFEKDKASRLTQYLEPNGALVVRRLEDLELHEDDQSGDKRCILVPHAQPLQHAHITKALPGTATATEWWVERCIHYKTLLNPNQDVLSQPLWNLSILGFSKMTISTTGFSGVDYRQVAEATKLAGANYQEQLAPSTSVLICGSANVKREKAYYAHKHRIPVVSSEWLWTCLRTQRKASFDRFNIDVPDMNADEVFGRPSASSPAPHDNLKRSSSIDARKDNQAPARLSNTRKRQATPSLPLQTHKTNPKPAKPTGPFVHEDEDEDDQAPVDLDQVPTATPHAIEVPERAPPLQNISPNASPRRPPSVSRDKDPSEDTKRTDDNTNGTGSHKKTTPPTTDEEQAAPPSNPHPERAQADWTADLASLVQRQQLRTASSEHQNPLQRMKHRKLGRAASGSSLTNRTNSGSTSVNQGAESTEASFEGESNGVDSLSAGQEGLPSTQIGYETPEAEAARLQMAKRMGTSYTDDTAGTRLASLGTVRDSSGPASAPGGRARNRTKR